MRIPITKYGLPQAAVFPAGIIAAMVIYYFLVRHYFVQSPAVTARSIFVLYLPLLLMLITLIWVFSFFRDPYRKIPQNPDLILAPADGTITDIEVVNNVPGFNEPAYRIGIFLSIFNVHINRTPCAVKFEKITYKEGLYKNAMDPDSAKVNESNDILMIRLNEPTDKLLVRQISGAIARRIVCDGEEGQELAGGQKFGMIKFGSRTELYIPSHPKLKCTAKVGNKVKAGITILARYEK